MGVDGIVYLILFLVGAVFLVVTFLVGELFEIGGEIAGDIGDAAHSIGDAIGGDGSSDLSTGVDQPTPSPFSSKVILSGLTAFGGVGFIGTLLEWPAAGSILAALGGAVLTCVGMYFLVIVPISKSQGSSHDRQNDFLNVNAQVTSLIPEKGVGQVTFLSPRSGVRVTQAARSRSGQAISQGMRVTVVETAPGLCIVEPKP